MSNSKFKQADRAQDENTNMTHQCSGEAFGVQADEPCTHIPFEMADGDVARLCWLASFPQRIRVHGHKRDPHSHALCCLFDRHGLADVDSVALSDSLFAVMNLKYEAALTSMTVTSEAEREQIEYWKTLSVFPVAGRLHRSPSLEHRFLSAFH